MSASLWHDPTPEPEDARLAAALAALTPAYHLIGPSQVADALQPWLQRKGRALILDTETTGLDPFHDELVTIQFGDDQHAYILDMRFYDEFDPVVRRGYFQQVGQGLAPLFDGRITMGGHNLKFDLVFLQQHLGLAVTPRTRVYDTMLAEQILLGGEEDEDTGQRLSANMLYTASRYGLPVTKEQRAYFPGLRDRFEWFLPLPTEQLEYIARDCSIPALIAKQQAKRLCEENLLLVNTLEQRLLPALAAMEYHGVYIDVDGWRAYIRAQQAEERDLHRKLVAMLSPDPRKPINIRSPKQLLTALNKLPKITLKSTERDVLKKFQGKHPAIDTLMAHRQVGKVPEMFGDSILDRVIESRVHPSYKQIIRTGRMACEGPNWQQLPAHQAGTDTIRHHVVAPPGYKLVIADFSNIEARFLAEFSLDPMLLRLFAGGGDFHSETARMIFGLGPQDDPRKTFFVPGVTHRQAAKTINFALMFGMGAQSMADDLGIPVRKASELMKLYFATYAGVKRWLTQTGREGVEQGYSLTLSGRIRRYRIPPKPVGASPQEVAEWEGYIAGIRRQACNTPIQGSAADTTKRAVVLLFARLPAGVWITSVVHDEIVVECRDDLVDEVKDILEATMQEASGHYLKRVANPRPEAVIQSNWVKA